MISFKITGGYKMRKSLILGLIAIFIFTNCSIGLCQEEPSATGDNQPGLTEGVSQQVEGGESAEDTSEVSSEGTEEGGDGTEDGEGENSNNNDTPNVDNDVAAGDENGNEDAGSETLEQDATSDEDDSNNEDATSEEDTASEENNSNNEDATSEDTASDGNDSSNEDGESIEELGETGDATETEQTTKPMDEPVDELIEEPVEEPQDLTTNIILDEIVGKNISLELYLNETLLAKVVNSEIVYAIEFNESYRKDTRMKIERIEVRPGMWRIPSSFKMVFKPILGDPVGEDQTEQSNNLEQIEPEQAGNVDGDNIGIDNETPAPITSEEPSQGEV